MYRRCLPQGNDIEHTNDPESASTYECLQCTAIVESDAHPNTCECGGQFTNRAKSLE